MIIFLIIQKSLISGFWTFADDEVEKFCDACISSAMLSVGNMSMTDVYEPPLPPRQKLLPPICTGPKYAKGRHLDLDLQTA